MAIDFTKLIQEWLVWFTMEIKQKIKLLEDKGFNWFEIADILDLRYDYVRAISELEDEGES